MELIDNRNCYVCGPDNERGLHAVFSHSPGSLTTDFVTEDWMQGYADIVHGGIITTLLDEAMVKLLFLEGHNAVSAELTVKLKCPVKPGETIQIKSHISSLKSRIIKTEATATLSDGTLVAKAVATCIIV